MVCLVHKLKSYQCQWQPAKGDNSFPDRAWGSCSELQQAAVQAGLPWNWSRASFLDKQRMLFKWKAGNNFKTKANRQFSSIFYPKLRQQIRQFVADISEITVWSRCKVSVFMTKEPWIWNKCATSPDASLYHHTWLYVEKESSWDNSVGLIG